MTSRGPTADAFLVLAASLHFDRGAYAALIGSGMSTAAGIMTGWEFTKELAELEARHREGKTPPDIEAWWAANKDVPLSYSAVVEALAPTLGQRQALLKSIIEPTASDTEAGLKAPAPAHHALAELVVQGYVKVILTTNFDRLIETALRAAGIEAQMLSGPEDLPRMIPIQHATCTVIKLHGDYQHANLRNTDAELEEYQGKWRALLRRVLSEYGLFTVGWSGQSDTALRAEITATAVRLYGCFLGARGGLHAGLESLAAEGRARIVPIANADEFFDELAGTLKEVGHRPTRPLKTSATVGTAKRLISQGRTKIELREVLLREARLLKDRLDLLDGNGTGDYLERLADVARLGQPLAGAVAIGSFYGAPEDRRLWTDVFRVVADQPHPMSGYTWMQGAASRRFPATMLLYSAALGAWAVDDFDLICSLLQQPVRHSFIETSTQELRQLPSCPAYVALAPPETVDGNAIGMGPGSYVFSNKVVEAIMPVLLDQYPVNSDFALAFEEIEYVMALLQHNWHSGDHGTGHARWTCGTFHKGLVGVPGAFAGPQPIPVADRFDEHAKIPGFEVILRSFEYYPGDLLSAQHAVALHCD